MMKIWRDEVHALKNLWLSGPVLTGLFLLALAGLPGTAVAAHTVTRAMPATYVSGTPFTVTLNIAPDITVNISTIVYAVEDTIPTGWHVVTPINESGGWHYSSRTVRWFFPSNLNQKGTMATTVSYTVVPVSSVTANGTFNGSANFDWNVVNVEVSSTVAIIGNRTITRIVPPTITIQPSAQYDVVALDPVTFTVAANGTAPLSYQWHENGIVITGATSPSYTIDPVPAGNNGFRYYCAVSNAAGRVASSTATLNVLAQHVAPVIQTQPVSRTIYVGQIATFSVTLSAGTSPQYQWRRNESIAPGVSTNNVYYTPTQSTAGSWPIYCQIKNPVGNIATSTVTLTVNVRPPTINTQPSAQIVTEGSRATFSVAASGAGTLTYQWQRDGVNIAGATSASYTTPVLTVANDDGAMFRCAVTNNPGGTTYSAEVRLTVNAVPAPSVETGFQPFANIFDPKKGSVEIKYNTSEPFALAIYDRAGQEVRKLEGSTTSALWDGKNKSGAIVASGTYVVILKKDGKTFKKKLVVVK